MKTVVAVLVLHTLACATIEPEPPGPPSLTRSEVRAFVTWAAATTTPDEVAVLRRRMDLARHDPEVAPALADHALERLGNDHAGALVACALLGDMRGPYAEDALRRIVDVDPLAVATPLVGKSAGEGEEAPAAVALAQLQAKAIDGLAYLRSPGGDAAVLKVAGTHGSRIVRAAAIDAYLWNRGDSPDARAALARVIRPDERIFLDRIRREPGESAEAFDRKLATFIQAHPELVPPNPQRRPQ